MISPKHNSFPARCEDEGPSSPTADGADVPSHPSSICSNSKPSRFSVLLRLKSLLPAHKRHRSIASPAGMAPRFTQYVTMARGVILPGEKAFFLYSPLQKSGDETPDLSSVGWHAGGWRTQRRGDAGDRHQPPLRWPSVTCGFFLPHRDSREVPTHPTLPGNRDTKSNINHNSTAPDVNTTSHHQAAGDRVERQRNPTLIDEENVHLGPVQFGILNTLCFSTQIDFCIGFMRGN